MPKPLILSAFALTCSASYEHLFALAQRLCTLDHTPLHPNAGG